MKMDFSVFILACTTLVVVGCSNGNYSFDLDSKSDKFDQNITYNNKVDILWIVDNSTSMLKHQQSLSAQIPDLVAKLNSLKMDYNMAVVTTSLGGDNPDGGRFIGTPKFVNSRTPNLVNDLTSRMIVGEAGSNNERGLESMERVFSSSYLANEGKGFFRNDALLVVIALSDEDDHSKSNSAAAVTYYKNLLDSIKTPWVDGTRSWVFNFIGVLSLTSGCKTFNDYAEAGASYIGLADESGGVKESICSTNLSSAVSNIRSRIYQILTDFKLSTVPDISTIVVKINGAVIPRSSVNGWDYISSINAVRFYGTAVPAADASISVDFKVKEAN